MGKTKKNGYKDSYRKMTPDELALWLHANRKAHAIESAKAYSRKKKHKNSSEEN